MHIASRRETAAHNPKRRKLILRPLLGALFALLSFPILAQPATCVVSGTVLDGGSQPIVGTVVRFRTITPTVINGAALASQDLTTLTASNGTWALTLVQGLNAQVDIPAANVKNDTVIPTGGSCPAAFSALTLYTRGTLTPATILSNAGPSMGGDLTGSSPNPSVIALRGQPLASGNCTNGQARVYSSGTSSYTCQAVASDANALLGTTLRSTVVNSSLTSVGTLGALTVTAPIAGSVTGSAGSATTAGTVTTAAQPAITSVGTLSGLTVTAPIAGGVTGDAALDVKADGTRALAAGWNAGNFRIDSQNSTRWFSVKAYGAVGNGIADDTAAIQATINAAPATGGVVYVPSTTAGYLITAGLTVTGKVGLSLLFDPGAKIIAATPTFNMLLVDSASSHFHTSGGYWQGTSIAEEGSNAIRIESAYSSVTYSYFTGTNGGVIIHSEAADHCAIQNNWFVNIVGITSGNGYASYTIGEHTIISGNHYNNVGRHDIYLSGSSPNGANYAKVYGNVSTGNGLQAIPVYARAGPAPLVGISITGNTILNCNTGIAIDSNVFDTVISGNVINGTSGAPIFLEGASSAGNYPTHNIISNNQISGNASSGAITLVNSIENVVTGNTITQATGRAVSVTFSGSPDVPPTGNIVSGNTIIGGAVVFVDSAPVAGTILDGLDGSGNRLLSGTLTAGGFAGPLTGNVTGNASTATSVAALATPRTINGVNFDGSTPITVTADANTLTGTTLKSTVIASSLASVGTLANLTVTAAPTFSALTSGYLPKAGTAGLMGNSPVYTDGTNVGVGTVTGPQNTLTLQKLGADSTTPGIDFFSTLSTGFPTTPFNSGRIYTTFDNVNYANARITLAYPTGANTFSDGLTLKGSNLGLGTNVFGGSALGVFAIANGTAPTTAPANMIQLWSESSTLKVLDGAGNETTLSGLANFPVGVAPLDIKDDNTKALRLSGYTSGFVGLRPSSVAGSTTYTLPAADGTTGDVLSTNGAGLLAWASNVAFGGGPLGIASGGTGTGSTLAGLVRGSGSAMTAAELSGDGTTSGSNALTVTTVGGSSAANIHAAELIANSATAANTASTAVLRNSSGNFSAGTITAALTGAATSSTGTFIGDVTGTEAATIVGKIQGRAVSAAAPANLNCLAWVAANSDWEPQTCPGGGGLITSVNASGGSTGLSFGGGPITTGAGTLTLTGTLAIANGGTGNVSAANAFNALQPMSLLGDVLYGGASGAGTRLAGNTSTTPMYLRSTGAAGAATAPVIAQINAATDFVGATPVVNGGTGAATLTGYLKGNGTSAVTAQAVPIPVADGGTGAVTLAAGYLHGAGTGAITSSPTVSLTSEVAGVLPVANGGSGAATLTGILSGNGTSAITGGAIVDLTSQVTGVLPVANGGSGGGSAFTLGSVIFANVSGNLAQDNAKLFWDDTNFRLSIGTATPTSALTVTNQSGSTSPAVAITATAPNYDGLAITGPTGSGNGLTISGTSGQTQNGLQIRHGGISGNSCQAHGSNAICATSATGSSGMFRHGLSSNTAPTVRIVTVTSQTADALAVNGLLLTSGVDANGFIYTGNNFGGTTRMTIGSQTEYLTLSTIGATTDTTANLLPANSIIKAIDVQIVTGISTATAFSVGDATTAARFLATGCGLTAGTKCIGLASVDQTGAAGPKQLADAKVRVTTTGTASGGTMNITTFYETFTP